MKKKSKPKKSTGRKQKKSILKLETESHSTNQNQFYLKENYTQPLHTLDGSNLEPLYK